MNFVECYRIDTNINHHKWLVAAVLGDPALYHSFFLSRNIKKGLIVNIQTDRSNIGMTRSKDELLKDKCRQRIERISNGKGNTCLEKTDAENISLSRND